MVDPARVRRLRAVGWLMVLALLTISGCSGPSTDGPPPSGPYIVSYSGAAERLTALDPLEADEQLRDWARLGLASELRLDRNQIVDALYDTTPIRDPSFTDLVEQPTGPGRALFDGTTLHLLVPDGDPHRSRTIGLLLDKQRTDAGVDPTQVQVHRYRVHPENQTIELSAEPAAPTGAVRAANGWIEARVDQPPGLADFLAATNNLSRLETRGPEIWATGWHWPELPGAPVTAQDVSALQRGYQQADGGALPRFSLDPELPATLDDIRATIPDLDPTLAERIFTKNWAGSGYASAADLADLVEKVLFGEEPPAPGLPADRTQLWGLDNLLDGGPVYSQARYDGGLAGTEIGMSLFYTDFVAKDWTSGVGTGVPTDAVPGFVPDPQAPTPPSLCPRRGEPLSEFGRLWFGQDDRSFTFEPNGVSIGAQATRLFSRTNGPDGTEVEPSFRFGRGLHFWDQHYQDVADYEPQYHRLEQLMRWSGALEWLTSTGGGVPPQLPDSEVRSGLTFADWYAAHDQLRERKPLTLVTPPSAGGTEAVLPTPSASVTTPGCPDFLQIKGGVSLADALDRSRSVPSDGAANVSVGLRRAGPADPATTNFDPTTHSGTIDQITLGVVDGKHGVTDRVTRTIRSDPSGTSVEAVGAPRRSLSLGGARLSADTGPRRLETQIRSNGQDFSYDTAFQGQPFAGVDSRVADPRTTEISLRPTLLERLPAFIERIRQDPVHGLDGVPDLLYSYPGPDGRTVDRIGEGWVESGPPGTSLLTGPVAEVTAVSGAIVPVIVGKPLRLSDTDVSHLEITQGAAVIPFGDLPKKIPPNTPIYLGTLLGTEPGAPLPGPISSDARVSYRVATLTSVGSSVAGENRSWSLAGGGGGSGPGGHLPPGSGSVATSTTAPPATGSIPSTTAPGGGSLPADGQIVLVTLCPVGQPQSGADCNP